MNGSLMKRLFRAISVGRYDDVKQVAMAIIDDETKKGHSTLAHELTGILRAATTAFSHEQSNVKSISLTALPKSKRYEEPLATHIPPEKLQHHMILPNITEERFQRIEREYAARERLAKYGLTPKRKILFYGPPGCGKTMGAQRLAWNTGLPLIKVRFDSIVSSYLGETATNLRAIFDAANQTPCLLFIDECDSVAKSRAASQEVGEIKRVVNSFLQLLDEYEAPGILVAATNLDNQLDSAVWRRFDDVLEIPKPGPDELKKLITWTLVHIESAICDWIPILEAAKGHSAAQIVKIAQSSAKRAILEGNGIVTQETLINEITESRGGE